MLSHGFLENSINKKLVNNILEKISKEYSTEILQGETYFNNINSIIPTVKNLINQKIENKIKLLLETQFITLEQIELHILLKNGNPIPHHQDNFYHCISPEDSLKILIPLQPFNKTSGALGFMNCNHKYKTLNHKASSIKNFSAYIQEKDFKDLKYDYTFYDYKVGDSSYHFVSSVHYSYGNKTNKDSYFLVFRFESSGAKKSQKDQKKYELVRAIHLSKINK